MDIIGRKDIYSDFMTFIFERLSIPGVVLIKPEVFNDKRGFFMESYRQSDFSRFGISNIFVQDSRSFSKKGVLRGLHFQTDPFEQGKLVNVVKGRILDVAVDVCRASKTFGKYVSVELSEANRNMVYVPRGFAHGFVALEDSVVEYKVDNPYSKDHESGIMWNDPEVNIKWPISTPLVSEKDSALQSINSLK